MNFLAIDYWTKKSWLAANFWTIPMPICIIETAKLINTVKKEIKERKIDSIIIWIAHHVDWSESDQSKKIRAFANVLKKNIPNEIQIIFHDERFSSFEAVKTLELAWEKKFDADRLDDMAASIILESYLNSID